MPADQRPSPQSFEEALRAFYEEVDARIAPLLRTHADRLRCSPGCSPCCIDGISVFEVEAVHLAARNRALLDHEAPHEPGACAFLDERGRCRVYADRPYVCRTQGLPLRWLHEDCEGGIVEMRDICPLNERGTPTEELPEEDCWTIGPAEERLSELQTRFADGTMRRVLLRDLFRKRDG